MSGGAPNYGLKDEIAAYWNARSATFDASPGHGIAPGAERAAWDALLTGSLGSLRGKHVLELACGTGEFTSLLLGAGAMVTGIDLSPGMLARARRKLPGIALHIGDAEDTGEIAGRYDAVVCRHLVWTLPNPAAAFADWIRVMRPGGRLLVVDGDWVKLPPLGRMSRAAGMTLMRLMGRTMKDLDWAAHEAIMRHVYFRDGVRPRPLSLLLEAAGFSNIETGSIASIRRAQRMSVGFPRRLTIGVYDDFWLTASKNL